jgi:hypothetical protein
MKKLKTILASIGILAFAMLPALGFAQVAFADSALDCGTRGGVWDTTASTCSVAESTTDANQSVSDLVKMIINILSWVVGIVSVVMIIIAGFKYVTSGGNDSSVTSAKNTILYAIVGLVIVALAQVIVRFVLSKLTTTP